MCVNKNHQGDSRPSSTSSVSKTDNYATCLSDGSCASYDDGAAISFGPIKVKPRKKPAPTLATGRRSKYEVLDPEEEQKRNVRRARNRAAAERVRVNRLNIERQLLNQISALERQEEKLLQDVQMLEHQKLNLETRLFTHEQMCCGRREQDSFMPLEMNLSYAPTQLPLSSQEHYMATYAKPSELDFESSFIESLPIEQMQQIFPDSFSSILTEYDLDDLLVN